MDKKSMKEISRRDAIKILGGLAGAVALANIPDKWIKPGLELGVLPAHAQTSTPAGIYTLVVGPSEPGANYCFDLSSTATISPVATGVLLRYTITLSPGLTLDAPIALTDTVATNASGIVQLLITVNTNAFNVGDTVTVNWTFENASDGTDSGDQIFTSDRSGC